MRQAPCLVVAHRAAALAHEEEVIEVSCPNENCRKGGCSTEPRPSDGRDPKRR